MLFLIITQFLLATLLIILILLHQPSSQGLGSMNGQAGVSGSRSAFEAGLNRVTSGIAILFFLISIVLYSSH